MLDNKLAMPTIDDDEWNEFVAFCRKNKVLYKIIYDYDEAVIVSIRVYDLIAFQLWLNGDRDGDEAYYELAERE